MMICLAAFVAITFSSCGTKNTPEAVADKFLTHISNGDYDKAAEYGTAGTKQMLQMVKAFGGDDMPKQAKPENLVCEVEDNKAKCTYTVNGEEDSIDLVLVDGKWLVDQQK